MDSETLQIIFGSVVRHGLSVAAAFLAGYGVTQAQQTSLVDSLTPIILAVAIALGSQIWSYLSKKAALNSIPK